MPPARDTSILHRRSTNDACEVAMNVGKTIRIYVVEPVKDPVPRRAEPDRERPWSREAPPVKQP